MKIDNSWIIKDLGNNTYFAFNTLSSESITATKEEVEVFIATSNANSIIMATQSSEAVATTASSATDKISTLQEAAHFARQVILGPTWDDIQAIHACGSRRKWIAEQVGRIGEEYPTWEEVTEYEVDFDLPITAGLHFLAIDGVEYYDKDRLQDHIKITSATDYVAPTNYSAASRVAAGSKPMFIETPERSIIGRFDVPPPTGGTDAVNYDSSFSIAEYGTWVSGTNKYRVGFLGNSGTPKLQILLENTVDGVDLSLIHI